MATEIVGVAKTQGPFEVAGVELTAADCTTNAPVIPASANLGFGCRNFWALIHEKVVQGALLASVNSLYALQVSSENTFASPYMVSRHSINNTTGSPGSIIMQGVLPHIASGWNFARVVYTSVNNRLATFDVVIRAS